jgi:methyl-accepting chemotaxis protein
MRINWHSLQAKLNMAIILLTSVILFGFGVYDYISLDARMTSELSGLTESVGHRLSINIISALWDINPELGRSVIASEMKDPRVHAIVIRDKNAKEPFLALRRDEKSGAPVELKKEDLEKGAISTTKSVQKETKELGSAEVYITKKFMQKELRESLTYLFLRVFLLDVILFIGMSLAVKRLLDRPIKAIVQRVGDIANGEGDLTMRLEVRSKDEIGELAELINQFLGSLQKMISEISQNADVLGESSSNLSGLSQKMSQGADQMSAKANSVAAASEEMSSNIDSVAATMEQASTNIGIIASSAQEMTATIGEISKNSEKARTITEEAVSQARSASVKVDELGVAAQQIGKVTEAITEISEQTNLLALNATIEAARAGEAGKGFAVVANEIKELARQTASATQEIKAKIEAIQATTSGTVTEIGQIQKIINDVNEIVATIAAAVEEQSVTTEEIANNVSQASQGIQLVNENVSSSNTVSKDIAGEIALVNQSTAEISNGTSQLSLSAEDMAGLAAKLKEMVGRFKV